MEPKLNALDSQFLRVSMPMTILPIHNHRSLSALLYNPFIRVKAVGPTNWNDRLFITP